MNRLGAALAEPQADKFAIHIEQLSKTYRLHGSQADQLIDVLNLQRFGLRTHSKVQEFPALTDVNLKVERGQRIGIVGRNGAGKSTLLKLICGNVTPTSGTIDVNGTVQALLSMGLGFHPDYTGRENVKSSLQYNGLSTKQYKEAIEGIVDFCELNEFFDQPVKTYSSGMQARLMFAAATAVNPDILIVDEVLGAGDAYFIAKSKRRVESLIGNGCTMLLVSHSMQQILELCDQAIWMDQGTVRMRGDSFEVVKAYEEYLHGPIQTLLLPEVGEATASDAPAGNNGESADDPAATPAPAVKRPDITRIEDRLQEPRFLPHAADPDLPDVETPHEHKFQARGGLSRWDSEIGLKIVGSTFVTPKGESNEWVTTQPVKCIFTLVGEKEGFFDTRFAFCMYDHLGKCILDIVSGRHTFTTKKGQLHRVELIMNPLQLGPGEYTISISAHDYKALALFNSTRRYDLLSRSLSAQVDLPDTLKVIESGYYHTGEWTVERTS